MIKAESTKPVRQLVTMAPIFLDLLGVAEAVSLSIGTVQMQKLVREKKFPQPRLLSGRRVGWLVREVVDWAEARPISDLLPPGNTGARGATDPAT
ncbi:transcriptional regulator, AlpA family [Burkholderia sp. D7]|nr:transcriptional regulator, AlpA family [Burkholderia sp. D7]